MRPTHTPLGTLPVARSRRLRLRNRGLAALAAIAVAGVWAGGALADGRTEYLTRMLRESESYRVRLTAANTLGTIGDPAAVPALMDALRDENPTVRAAAAASLGRIGDPSALPALEGLATDPVAAVRREAERSARHMRETARRAPPPPAPTKAPAAPGRYVVGLDRMANNSGVRGEELSQLLRQYVAEQLGRAPDTAVAPDGSPPVAAPGVTPFLVGGSVRRVARTDRGIRAEVSILLMDTGQNLRASLGGAATVETGGNLSPQAEADVQNQALHAAVEGAFRHIGQVMEQTAH